MFQLPQTFIQLGTGGILLLCSILQILNICDQFLVERMFKYRVNMKTLWFVLKNLEIRGEGKKKQQQKKLANQSLTSQSQKKKNGSPLQQPFCFVNLCGSPGLTKGWTRVFWQSKDWVWTDQQGAAVQPSSLVFSSCFSLLLWCSLQHCSTELFSSLSKNEKETTLHNQ